MCSSDLSFILCPPVLDTGGHAEFATLRSSYIDSGDGYLLVFDVTNRKSFEHLRDYLREVRVAKDDDDVPLILVANKCDVKGRQVSACGRCACFC